MLSFQKSYERLQAISGDSDSPTLLLFKSWLNEGSRKCYNTAYKEALIGTATDLTEAAVYSYPLPAKCGKMDTVKVTVSGIGYPITEFSGSDDQWNALLNDGSESDYPQYFRQKANTIEYYPTFATAGNTIAYRFKKRVKDMAQDDYATGSILTATNGGTGIVGNAPSWTTAMAGRFIKITGDEDWYEIASVTNSTTLVLARQYAGTSISGGTTAYVIGEMNLLDETYQDTPIFYALYFYYLQKENINMATTYFNMLPAELRVNLLKEDSSETVSGVLSEEVSFVNPNDYPSGLTPAS